MGVSIHGVNGDIEAAAATEGTPLLGGREGQMDAFVSRPISLRVFLAISNGL